MLPLEHPDRIQISFDDHRLAANVGLLLPGTLAQHLGLRELVDHHVEQPSFEEELAQDVLEIITVFSARLYGSRSHQGKKLLDALSNDGEGSVVETARQLSRLG